MLLKVVFLMLEVADGFNKAGNFRFNLRNGKSSIYNQNVQVCDATDASFMFFSLAQKYYGNT